MSDITKKKGKKKSPTTPSVEEAYGKPTAEIVPDEPIQTEPIEPGVTVSIEMGGKKSGKSKTVKEAAKKLAQMDMAKEAGQFKKDIEKAGAPNAEVSLQPGHDVSTFQQAPLKPGSQGDPLQYSQVNCVSGIVEATNGRMAIRVPVVQRDIHYCGGDGVISIDLSLAKEIFKRPGKDEEVNIDLTQTWEKSTIERRSIIKEQDTSRNVEMNAHPCKNAPNIAAIVGPRKMKYGARAVVGAEYLKKIAEYAAKNGDGTIMIDIVDKETSLYFEVPVDECGVAEIVLMPSMVKDIDAPYRNAVKITER